MGGSQLRIVIVEGKELKANGMGGTSDPFCILKANGSNFKTETVKKNLAPVWNHIVDLYEVDDSTVLEFEVFDYERIGSHKSLGEVAIGVAQLKANTLAGSRDQWLNLSKKGFIRISYDFIPPLLVATLDASGSVAAVSSPVLAYGIPPPVFFPPQFTPNQPVVSSVTFVTPNETYFKKIYVTGSSIDSAIVYAVADQFITVRSLYVTLKGKIYHNGKRIKTLVNDARNLLQLVTGGKMRMGRGKHLFPFQFFIPKECQSSIAIDSYKVEYTLTFFADIVNCPDVTATKTIQVVNIEDTNYKITQSPIDQSNSKSPITGGSIEMRATASKNSYCPGEDVELEVTVINKSKKTIKKIDIDLFRLDDRNASSTDRTTTKVATAHKHLFPKVCRGGKATQNMVFELPANLVPSTYYPKAIKIEYQLWVELDLPNCIDLQVKIPITIVFPDPSIMLTPNPLNELSVIPTYIHAWTAKHVTSWMLFRMKSIPVAAEFERFAMTGIDIMTSSPTVLQSLIAIAGDRAPEIMKELTWQIDRINIVRTLLKDLQLPHLIDIFEEHCITSDVLPDLTEKDLVRIDVKTGDRKRILKAINPNFKSSVSQ
eukprot:gene7839-9199_t